MEQGIPDAVNLRTGAALLPVSAPRKVHHCWIPPARRAGENRVTRRDCSTILERGVHWNFSQVSGMDRLDLKPPTKAELGARRQRLERLTAEIGERRATIGRDIWEIGIRLEEVRRLERWRAGRYSNYEDYLQRGAKVSARVASLRGASRCTSIARSPAPTAPRSSKRSCAGSRRRRPTSFRAISALPRSGSATSAGASTGRSCTPRE
jgi:hypothetical protein